MSPDRPARPSVIEAAGCVVWRPAGDDVEILVVHRPPPHDDWSLPKGKLDAGETHATAALREVHEETGVRGELGDHLGEVRYDLHDGRRKHVRFWSLRAVHEDPRPPDDEVDELRWVAVADAAGELDWDSDRTIVASFVARLGGSSQD